MSTKSLIIILIFCSKLLFAQTPIDVTEQTIKISGLNEIELYFGFATGDKIIFNFKEVNSKEVKEIEILEYPNNSKFSDYKSTQIDNKIINVTKQGVYVFRFKNTAIGGRIAKIKIQRIPVSNETINFNSTVTWATKQETTYNSYTKDVLVGYDTTYTQKTKKILIKTELKEELICDKTQRVHSTTNDNGNKTSIFFTLPENLTTPYKTTKVISWAYWTGVGNEANIAWKQNSQTISNLAKGVASFYTTPLGALAVGAVTDLMIPKTGEDVFYAISDQINRDLFLTGKQYKIFDQGKGVAGYRKFINESICQGTYFVLLSNDNIMQGIDTTVKVVAIVETNIYNDQQFTETNLSPRYEKKTFSEPVITTIKYPVISK
ncbi:hypothetical protein [Flavobacterium terrigena]|uniref:Por secretion system C-terminal sorting domain-containing protein n=1 Tax=Flavobacterium terrigena TaxID=402734 RepID=A0A1H6SJI3_9FLAO|nr:hypothetical protein [Flavobacterium terrigena]SEI63622.1 hypothetical protein SAMN05660918_1231 [Flavobacterium terrigena]